MAQVEKPLQALGVPGDKPQGNYAPGQRSLGPLPPFDLPKPTTPLTEFDQWDDEVISAIKRNELTEELLDGLAPEVLWRAPYLCLAAHRGDLLACELLLSRVDLDATFFGKTALAWASASGHAEICALLDSAEANGNVVDPEGHTPQSLARYRGHLEAAEALTSGDNKARMSMREAIETGDVQEVYNWIQQDADPTYAKRVAVNVAAKVQPNVALMLAAREGMLDLVRDLVESGIDVDAVDTKGRSALLHAAASRQKKVVAYLLLFTDPAERVRLRNRGWNV